MNITVDDIQDLATKLLNDCDLQNQFPVLLEKVAECLEYVIKKFTPTEKTKSISGALLRDKKLIFINETDSLYRQRFTIAHEIGHHVLYDGDHVDYRTESNWSEEERNSDEFAACLLMPKEKFLQQYKNYDGNTFLLSRYFGVSEPAVGVRIFRLGLDK